MAHGYGGPGAPSPDGDPDEWHRSFRAPRPIRRDATTGGRSGYADTGEPYPGTGQGYPAASEPGYPTDGRGPAADGRGSTTGGRGYPSSAADSRGYSTDGTGYPAAGQQGYPPDQRGYPPAGQRAYPPGQGSAPPARPANGYPPRSALGPGGPAAQLGPAAPPQGRPGTGAWPRSAPPSTDRAYPDHGTSGYPPANRPGGRPAYPDAPPPGGRYGYAGPQTGGARQLPRQRPGYPSSGYPGSGSLSLTGRGAPMDDLVGRTAARPPAQDDPAPKPRKMRRALYAVLTTLVLLTVVGYAVVYFTRGNTATKTVTSSTPIVLPKSDPILTRTTDPKPLTAAEVFGHATIRSSATGGDYTVSKAQTITGCGTVATAKIAAMLSSLGCSQVVRADLTSPDGTYVITAGIANLPDQTSASTARTSIKSLIEGGTDHFNAYTLALASPPPTQPTTHLGWDTRGHYLFYVVIGLASGASIDAKDERTPLIISDIIERYLSTTVIGAREKVPATAASAK